MNWPELRYEMVERQLRRRGIKNERVLAAMLAVPREQFVPEAQRERSYEDTPLPIGHGQSISQPYITALMTECLGLSSNNTILEIGAGSGYHTAVLALLAARVVAIETIPELAEQARQNLERTGHLNNVTIVCADGSGGWPEFAPYDAISVAAGAPEIPWQLLEQLADPGRLVIPVGSREDQDLKVVAKENGIVSTRTAGFCRFVPLRGEQGWR